MTEEERAARVVKMRYVIVVAVVGPFLGMILLAGYITIVSRGNQQATCAVVETQLRATRARLNDYEETPPTTEAGRNIQNSEIEAAEAWGKLSRALSCESGH